MDAIADELDWLTDHQEFQQIELLKDWRDKEVEEVRAEVDDIGVENLREIIGFLREELSETAESTIVQELELNDVPLSVSLLLVNIAGEEGELEDWDYIRNRADNQEELEELFKTAIEMYTSQKPSDGRSYDRGDTVMEKCSRVIHGSLAPRLFKFNDGYDILHDILTDEIGFTGTEATLILDTVLENRESVYRTYQINRQDTLREKVDDLSKRLNELENKLRSQRGQGIDDSYRQETSDRTIQE